jgi:hypothetical protein
MVNQSKITLNTQLISDISSLPAEIKRLNINIQQLACIVTATVMKYKCNVNVIASGLEEREKSLLS